MDDIQIYISEGLTLRLKFFDAVHPSLVHPKADHWKFIYKLYHGDKLFDNGFFTPNNFIDEKRQLLFIQEYDNSILNKAIIETDDDVIFNLRLFDFSRGKTGKFSKIRGGSFKIQQLVDNTLIFQKQYPNETKEYEVEIDKINMAEVAAR